MIVSLLRVNRKRVLGKGVGNLFARSFFNYIQRNAIQISLTTGYTQEVIFSERVCKHVITN